MELQSNRKVFLYENFKKQLSIVRSGMYFYLHRQHGKMGCGALLGVVILTVIIVVVINNYKEYREKTVQEQEHGNKSMEIPGQVQKRIADFEVNRNEILVRLRLLLESGDYKEVLVEAKKYLCTNDNELIQIYNKAREIDLYAKVRKVPIEDLETNARMYAELMGLNPTEKRYRDKYEYYTNKIKEHKKWEGCREKFGPPPTRSAGDGPYNPVRTYLRGKTYDPDSLEIDQCTRVHCTVEGWLVGCYYRGKKVTNETINQFNWFTIIDDNVTKIHDASDYNP